MVLLSPDEKMYIVHGVESNLRCDGREQLQYRPIELETGLISNAMGSSRVSLGNTDVIACVSANTFRPTSLKPGEGKMDFLINFSGIASPDFEGRKKEQISERYTTMFNRLYSGVRLHSLCIAEGEKCWAINIDVSILSIDGNLYDAISFAVKTALATTYIPKIHVINEDKGEREFKISDDPYDVWTPDISNIPFLITVSKVGDAFIVDATSNEEQCSSFGCIVAVTDNGSVLATQKIGPGCLQGSNFISVLTETKLIAELVGSELNKFLNREEMVHNREIIGFLD